MILDKGNGETFETVEHSMDELPREGEAMQLFVAFPGRWGMIGATWRDGEWCDLRGTPYQQAPCRWYSFERVAGETRH